MPRRTQQVPQGFQNRHARLVAAQEDMVATEPAPHIDVDTGNLITEPQGAANETPLEAQDWSTVDAWQNGSIEDAVEGEILEEGYESDPEAYETIDEGYGGEGYYDDCGGCGPCDGGEWSCGEYMTQGHFAVFGGVQGFKNGGNLGRDGSFGFQEGLNIGLPLPFFPGSGLGYQVGFRALQSNLSSASFTFEQRNQTFFTTGIFRRVPCGIQGAVVFDMLKDEWYDDLNLGQVRGEVSWKLPCQHEWGYMFAGGDSGDSTQNPIINGRVDRWTPVDYGAFFYRRRLSWCPGGVARYWAGFSGDDDGLLGAEAYLPMNRRWALNTSFTYLIPESPNDDLGNQNETWNLSMALVWSWNGHCEYQFRPLLDVADNGSFFYRTE